MKWFSFPRFLRRGNGKKAPSQPEKAVETAHQPEDENARSEKLPAPEKGRGPITHCDLASLSSLTLPFESDPFFRLRPPFTKEAAELSMELAQMTYTLELEPWEQAGWNDFSIQIDNSLKSGISHSDAASGEAMRRIVDAWKLGAAKAALNAQNPVSQVLSALRQRERSDTIKAVCMAHPGENGQTVIAIGFMGTGKRMYDWISNLRFSTEEGFHRGFYQLCTFFEESVDRIVFPATAARQGLEKLTLGDILSDMRSLRSPYRLWMAGHSQGGAVMQIFTNRLIQHWGVQPQNIVGYGFASPTVATGRLLYDPASYPLYHLLNSDDLVPRMGGLLHLGLCMEYPADDALRTAAYGLDSLGINEEAYLRLAPYRDAMQDTGSVLTILYAFLAALREHMEESEPGKRLEQQRLLSWLGKAMSFAGEKASDGLDWALQRIREGYEDLMQASLPTRKIHTLIGEFRVLFREIPLRRILSAIAELGEPPHHIMREKQPGAYAWIVENGLDKLRPFIWTTQSGQLPRRSYAEGKVKAVAVWNEYPVRVSRRHRRPARRAEFRGVLRRSYSALRRR